MTADEAYIRESVLYPSAKIVAGFENIMPTFKGQVSEEEIIQLIAYIKSLKRGETPVRVENYPPPNTTPPINPDTSTVNGRIRRPSEEKHSVMSTELLHEPPFPAPTAGRAETISTRRIRSLPGS